MATAPTAPNIEIRPWPSQTSIDFYWRPPTSDGGSPILYYTLSSASPAYTQDISADQSFYQVTGLTALTTYTFQLTATNANGTSDAATFRTVQTGTIPSIPAAASLTAAAHTTSNTVLLTWAPSTTASQALLRGYRLRGEPVSAPGVSSFTWNVYPFATSSFRGNLSTNTEYRFSIEAVNDVGYSVPRIYASTFQIATYSNGLRYAVYSGYFNDNTSYFDGRASTTAGLASTFSNISTGTMGALQVNGQDFYSVQWLGYFRPQVTGVHTFFTVSDDASYLWIGSNALTGYTTANPTVNNAGLHGMQERSGNATLTAGLYYPFRVQFGENSGGDDCSISVTPPSGTRTYTLGGYVYYAPF